MSLSNLRQRAASQRGFSLIELLVVVLIIGILAAIMIPRFLGQRNNANNSQAQSSLRNAASAAEAYYQQGEFYGDTISTSTAVNLSNAICGSEPSLTIVAGTSTCGSIASPTSPSGIAQAPGSTANPSSIWVVVSGTGKTSTATLCNASKGSKAYCLRLRGSDSAQYASSTTDVGNAYSSVTSTPNGW